MSNDLITRRDATARDICIRYLTWSADGANLIFTDDTCYCCILYIRLGRVATYGCSSGIFSRKLRLQTELCQLGAVVPVIHAESARMLAEAPLSDVLAPSSVTRSGRIW